VLCGGDGTAAFAHLSFEMANPTAAACTRSPFTWGPHHLLVCVLVAIGFSRACGPASRRALLTGIAARRLWTRPLVDFGTIVARAVSSSFLLARGNSPPTPGGDTQYPPRRTWFLRRTNRRWLAGMLYVRSKKLPAWKIATFSRRASFGPCVWPHRLFDDGCCYGRACSLPWAIHFPEDHETHGRRACTRPRFMNRTAEPPPLAFLAWLYRRKNFDGEIFATISWATGVRAFVERSAAITPPIIWRPRHTRPDSEPFHFRRRSIAVVGFVPGRKRSPELEAVSSAV